MPTTSATGTSTNSSRGFTLIEILVVMLIIGIMVAGTVFSVGIAHGDRELERERDRLLALLDYLRDQATLQNREFGLRAFDGGYQFLVWEPRERLWEQVIDDALRPRRVPRGLTLRLRVDGREVLLPEAEVKPDELAPQVLLYSSGEINLFELTIQRDPGGAGVTIAPARDSDRIEASALAAAVP